MLTISRYFGDTACKRETDLGTEKVMSQASVGVFPSPIVKERVSPPQRDNMSDSPNNPIGTQVSEAIEIPEYEEKSAVGWLIAIYIFAALGGLLGVVFGISTYMAKENVYNPLLGDYEKVPKYKSLHRTMALIGALLSIVSVFIWQFAFM